MDVHMHSPWETGSGLEQTGVSINQLAVLGPQVIFGSP